MDASDHTTIFIRCSKCGTLLPLTDENFQHDRQKSDGYRHECKSCRRLHYKSNAEEIKETNRAYREANPDKVRETNLRYSRKEEVKKRHKEYNQSHAEQIRKNNRSLVDRNRERYRAYWRNRWARKHASEGNLTPEDIQAQFKRQKGKCYYCNNPLGDDYELDHVVPLSRGGSNLPDNIVMACKPCNRSKHDKLPHEWKDGGRLC
jgi:5-methylcytosine-specific restriction endonuclease McrA